MTLLHRTRQQAHPSMGLGKKARHAIVALGLVISTAAATAAIHPAPASAAAGEVCYSRTIPDSQLWWYYGNYVVFVISTSVVNGVQYDNIRYCAFLYG